MLCFKKPQPSGLLRSLATTGICVGVLLKKHLVCCFMSVSVRVFLVSETVFVLVLVCFVLACLMLENIKV